MITIFEPIGTSHLELDKKEQIQLFSDWLKGLPHYSGVANSSVTLLFIIRKEISAFFSSDLFLSDKFFKNATKNRGEYNVQVQAQARWLSFSKSGLFRLSFT